MPEFVLNIPPSAADIRKAVAYGYAKPRKPHGFYDLDEFAKGFVEAMFFTNCDSGDMEREDHANELGVGRLTRKSLAKIKADCDKFQRENSRDLRKAKNLIPGRNGLQWRGSFGPLDDRRLGNLFWFSRQGHGIGFTDDGTAACLDRLEQAAQRFGECDIEIWKGWIHV